MWTKSYSKVFQSVSKEDIWRLMIDINNWTAWHKGLEYTRLEGEFAIGNSFMLKPKGKPAVKVCLVKINEGSSFTDCTQFPGAKMYDTHTLEETSEGLRISNTIVVTGLLQFLWTKLVAKKIAASIAGKIEDLVMLAKKT